MKSSMNKIIFREIRHTLGRFLAILAIIALGVGFFAGLKVSKEAMVTTGGDYLEEHNFYDFRVISTMGFDPEDVEEFQSLSDVVDVESGISMDCFISAEDGTKYTVKSMSLPENLNTLTIVDGRLPQTTGECVIDENNQNIQVGDTVSILDTNEEDTIDAFSQTKYEVVGKVKSPLYINFERGTTSIGDGKIQSFFYIQKDSYTVDYITDIYLNYGLTYPLYSDEYEDYIDEKQDEVEQCAKACLEARYDSIIGDAQMEIDDALVEVSNGQSTLDEEKEKADKELADALSVIEQNEKDLLKQEESLLSKEKDLKDSKYKLEAALSETKTQQETLTGQLLAVKDGLAQIDVGKKKIADGKDKIAEAKEEYEDGKKEAEEKIADAQEDLDEANEKLTDAQSTLDDKKDELRERKIYALTRDSNVGYATFESDASIVDGIANVFPVFFFLVAALICSTTMNRMVEDERTQIGVLKALGYGKMRIMSKYLIYSGSAAVIGCILGFIGGSYLFPTVIWQAYCLMYNFTSSIILVYDVRIAVISMIVSLLCSVGATYGSCYFELHSVPSDLIRPKAPKNGKRIFLERVPLIWKHLGFLVKVSIRNVVRYKKRFFMMVLGIGGCMALLLTGFGIKDSISDIVGMQYDEIQTFDATLTLDDELSVEEEEQFDKDTQELIEDRCYVNVSSVDLVKGHTTKSVSMVVPDDETKIDSFLDLHTGEKEKLAYPGYEEAILSDKVADKLGIKLGDTLTIRDADNEEITVIISGICENYVFNYVYISRETYEKLAGKELDLTTLYINYKKGVDEEKVTESLLKVEHVGAVSDSDTFRVRFEGMMTSLNYIVILIIFCAAALAFIVLYNLTNINITERIREIATIKVLGFYPNEVASYVFRENVVLTAIGSLVGCLFGNILLTFVIAQIDIDAVHFPVVIKPLSYLYSVVLTFSFAMFVNLVMNHKLNKINMSESLKSVE